MRIGIIGGGPAGLYFALLMKKHNPAHQIQVVEQNPAGATYGWGVVFSERALSFLKNSDPESYTDIEAVLKTWNDQTIVHRGEKVRIDGSGYSGIARLALLRILQEHCRRYGVEMQFETRVTDASEFADYDLLVGADGVNSVVRQHYAEHFQPSTSLLSNKYIWYGTHQLFDTLSLIFRSYRGGAFVAHCYPYSDSTSTFIVECDAGTWRRAGFEQMSEAESRAYCEDIFQDDLGGHALLLNKSVWLNFRVVSNRYWNYRNVVLLGDALRTVHFSIGSGTRMALEDAIALYNAFTATGDVPAALQAFEQARRPGAGKLLSIAQQSYTWYETFHEKMDLDPLALTYSYVTRSGRIDQEALRQKSPRFMARYEAYLAAKR
ncbi:MAG TPA: FAD-dependent monooxygenase [Ktedonobacteraceae bacterium]|nr:FAD-dependent monooxygenase [Ktedonobacteraceae bacterium]HZU66991.1 FAD-dependent monooxygenase [Ktedonobacteraceae bacterium]